MVLTKETAEGPGSSHIFLIASRSHPGSFGVFVKFKHMQSNIQNYNQCKRDKPNLPDSKPTFPPFSKSLDCSEETSCSRFPKHGAVRSLSTPSTTPIARKSTKYLGRVCQRSSSPSQLLSGPCHASCCVLESRALHHLLPVLSFQSGTQFQDLWFRFLSLPLILSSVSCLSLSAFLQTVETFDHA